MAFASRLVAIVAAAGLSACGLVGSATEHFVIRVDSVSAPDSLHPTDSLRAHFLGPIGPSGCWSLDHIERTRLPGEIQMQFIGAHVEATCTQQPVSLDYVEVIAPPFTSPFMVKVKQPDGSILSRSIVIR